MVYRNRAVGLALAAVFLVGISGPVFAHDAGQKLGRGLANVATGWVEIPKQVGLQGRETNAWDAFTKGLAKGFVHAFARTTVGAYEIISFPFPVPEGYRPIITTPEFVSSDYQPPVKANEEPLPAR